jgi:hypothetical protein
MRMRQITALLIPVIFLISGCEKQPDYREKYLGNWNFEIESSTRKDWWDENQSYTTYRKGEIKLWEGGNEILVQFEGIQYPDTLSIDPGGKIIPIIFKPWHSITYSYKGGFEGNNKLQYIYNYSHGIQTNIHKKVIGDRE